MKTTLVIIFFPLALLLVIACSSEPPTSATTIPDTTPAPTTPTPEPIQASTGEPATAQPATPTAVPTQPTAWPTDPPPATRIPAPTKIIVEDSPSTTISITNDGTSAEDNPSSSDTTKSETAAASSASNPGEAGAYSEMDPGRWPGPPGGKRKRRNHQHGAPKAGEIDDNELWNAYLNYTMTYTGPTVRTTPLRERYIITVTNKNGDPVHGAAVSVRQQPADEAPHLMLRTHSDGRALHHPVDGASEEGTLSFTASYGSHTAQVDLKRSPNGASVDLRLPAAQHVPGTTSLDVLFLLDSTGSMADEIARIKETLLSISNKVRYLPGRPDLRIGMVAYRDRGDEFVTRVFDFDRDIRRFARTVRNVEAEGGGDYPESLNEALNAALTQPSWRPSAIKLIFLIADAPPHLDYEQDHNYITEMRRAQSEGVKIFSIASSGLDPQGEYIFRQLAQQTIGKFVFILYETGPQGELTTPHEVGDDYSVQRLDRLIVRLITEELGSMTRQHPEAKTP